MLQITPKETPTSNDSVSRAVKTISQPQIRQEDMVKGEQGSEPPKEATASAETDPLSPKLAILAKREKLLRSREAEIKAKEDALKAKEAEYQSSYIPKTRLKDAAYEAFRAGELSYDELTQQMLQQPQAEVDPVIRELKATQEKLLAKIDALENGNKEQQSKEYQQALTQLGHDVKTTLSGNQDYELINSLGMHAKVVDLIRDTFEQEERIMSIEDAAKEIEEYLLEEAMKVTSVGKVKAKLTPQEPVEDKPETKQQPNQQQPAMRTLTNQVSASKPMTARERAILAFQGKL